MTADSTADLRRTGEDREHELAAIGARLDALRARLGIMPAALERATGLARERWYRVFAGEKPLHYVDVMHMPAELRDALLAEDLRDVGLALSVIPIDAPDVIDDVEALGTMARELAEAIGAFGDAIGRGPVTTTKARRSIDEIDDAIRVLTSVRARLTVALHAGVDGRRVAVPTPK